ncbi:MAG: TetR/AcrR family transcriptional regulator [Abyssibacter sp.]|nr:TetR/AcrR family transcriptional regulator [Abyssibacter sp.]MCK5859793.1 TetR/AcrR family transcriptional regulator [Abyssibacter sp.]
MARKRFTEEVRSRKREQILDAAMSVFENKGGLDALSFRSIAAELGVSYSTPYGYFSSKEDLVIALRTRAFRWMERLTEDAIQPSADPVRQLELLAAAYIHNGVARAHRYELMFFDLDSTDAAKNSLELRAAKRDALNVCTRVIASGQEQGVFPTKIDPLTASHIFWVSAHGLVSLQVAGQLVMGRDLDTLAPLVIHALRTGMEHYDPAAAPRIMVNQ